MSTGALCVREVCWRLLLATLLLVLLLSGPSSAYPARYSDQHSPLESVKRANSRGAIRVQPKADRFYLGPRFGKRSEIPADYGEGVESGAGELADGELAPTEQFSFRCTLAESDRVYRCHLGVEPARLSSE